MGSGSESGPARPPTALQLHALGGVDQPVKRPTLTAAAVAAAATAARPLLLLRQQLPRHAGGGAGSRPTPGARWTGPTPPYSVSRIDAEVLVNEAAGRERRPLGGVVRTGPPIAKDGPSARRPATGPGRAGPGRAVRRQ
jgi:hypothetical protein